MKFQRRQLVAAMAGLMLGLSAGAASAMGGPSGAAVGMPAQGHIGEVIVNPYKIAPLTAIVRTGGYVVKNASVRVVPKKGGREIAYKVSDRQIRTHAGIPIAGLYADYLNTVEVSYTRVSADGKSEDFTDRLQFYAPPVFSISNGMPGQQRMFNVEVNKVDPGFEDRLYLVNSQLIPMAPQGARFVWNNPAGGALEWTINSQIGIIDTAGDVRWYLLNDLINDQSDPWTSGLMMGFQQTKDGALTWGFGQRWVKYDLMGREIFNRKLPPTYADFSHAYDNAENGHSFLRVSMADYRRGDDKRVHTVRDTLIKALDQGAVCLNIDPAKAGQTLSAADLANMDKSDKFGDIPGTGPGRNWAHVNSIDYDPTDDSIILSARHQGIVKIGRDHQVKWILASPVGWKKGLAERVLTPVDKNSKPLKCEGSQCEGGFDWSWTQHTAWRIDSKSTKDVIYLSVFDNGDARGMEQPPLPTMKYSRAVVYKIDQKKMTVEQIWEVGKDLGYDYFSPVTGITKYMDDKDTMLVFWSTAGMGASPEKAGKLGRLHPRICEYRWGDKSLAVDLTLWDTCGYQAFPVSFEEAFSKN